MNNQEMWLEKGMVFEHGHYKYTVDSVEGDEVLASPFGPIIPDQTFKFSIEKASQLVLRYSMKESHE